MLYFEVIFNWNYTSSSSSSCQEALDGKDEKKRLKRRREKKDEVVGEFLGIDKKKKEIVKWRRK